MLFFNLRRSLSHSLYVLLPLNRMVTLVIPKFKISFKINLRNLLPKLGIKEIFTTRANFSYITKDVFPAFFEVSTYISRCPD